MKNEMPTIELIDFTFNPEGAEKTGLTDFSFSLFEGDCYSIETDSADDAALFLKALVTWKSPQKGTYCFNGVKIDLSDYRNALPCKRQMGILPPRPR
jgi:ABC-type dipeptide/oligopeptide/nickel transport system ATPase subunit